MFDRNKIYNLNGKLLQSRSDYLEFNAGSPGNEYGGWSTSIRLYTLDEADRRHRVTTRMQKEGVARMTRNISTIM